MVVPSIEGAATPTATCNYTGATVCPICGCDVAGCVETTGSDGLRRWTQATKEHWPQGSHRPRLSGGLTHIEGGTRCLSDAGGRQ